MKNVVSFETAKRLKEAGFPQPEFDTGEFWYDSDEVLCVITHGGNYKTGYCRINGLRDVLAISDEKDHAGIFAPTATDILRSTDIQIWWNDGERCFWAKAWPDNKVTIFISDNPAEAVAIAWLSINPKKDLQE